jgi:CBS domain-containing protein
LSTKLVSSIAVAARSRLRAVRADVPLRDVAGLLSSTQISLVVICDQQGVMVGVVTKSDIVRRMGHCTGRTCTDTADAIMTKNVISCYATDGLPDVLSKMQARGLLHLPVVDAEGKPSGVVNMRDALRELMLEGQYEEALLRDYVMGVGYH